MHTPQPGAQNHRTVGPENSGSSDTRSDGFDSLEIGLASNDWDGASEPHAARNVTRESAMTRRRVCTLST